MPKIVHAYPKEKQSEVYPDHKTITGAYRCGVQLRTATDRGHGACKLRAVELGDDRVEMFCRHGISKLFGKQSEKTFARELIESPEAKTVQECGRVLQRREWFSDMCRSLAVDGTESDSESLDGSIDDIPPPNIPPAGVVFSMYEREKHPNQIHWNKPTTASEIPKLQDDFLSRYNEISKPYNEIYFANYAHRGKKVFEFANKLKKTNHGTCHVYMKIKNGSYHGTYATIDQLYCKHAPPKNTDMKNNPDKHTIGKFVCGDDVALTANTIVAMSPERINQIIPNVSPEDTDN